MDFPGVRMNAGFTKIHALMLDDFVIYDSRVGAALGLLVRNFLTEKDIAYLPEVLHFAYGKARPTVGENRGVIGEQCAHAHSVQYQGQLVAESGC